MKILVLIKQVPDSTTNVKIRPDGEDIDRAGVKMVVNPFDEFAIELAVQLREKRGDVASITALTAGPATAAEALRTALAIGADDAIHLQDAAFEKLDEIQTAAVIAAVVRGENYDLIVRGKQEIDLDSGQLGPALAEMLDIPHVGAATKLDMAADGKSLVANRRIEGADEIVEARLPALLTIEKGLVECRYPSLPNLMKAKKKPVRTITSGDVAGFAGIVGSVGGTEIHKFEPPPQRPPGKVLKGDASETVPQLVKLLREEAKAI
ncbi:MAG: electron transfer flavoprotein subunit beta/FixA family protein [Planctomycetes bacterium]|nr:electron transfer flavoprotein subunit beta/FixA family protein [Planctomycetota bacterium]